MASFTATHDLWATERPGIEIRRSKAPGPDTFGGGVRMHRLGIHAWEEVPLGDGFVDNACGLGLASMARAVRSGGSPRASGTLVSHAPELMQPLETSAQTGQHVPLGTRLVHLEPLAPDEIAIREGN